MSNDDCSPALSQGGAIHDSSDRDTATQHGVELPLLARLAEGFSHFQQRWYCTDDSLYASLRSGQSPRSVVIACSDSRVDPTLLLDAKPGELFVVRNVANLVPPYEPDSHYHGVSAALEYAVCTLGVEHILIMGHAQCGGFSSLLAPRTGPDDEFITVWMSLADRARAEVDAGMADATPQERQQACEQCGVRLSLHNLLTFPWIRERVAAGTLSLHGLYFALQTGELFYYDEVHDRFAPLVQARCTLDREAAP